MSLTATLYSFDVALSHVDRGVYESLSIKAACHPSETEEYLLTRVLAYCLEYTDGIAFSKGGISDPDEPAITVKDLTGAWRCWIEVGLPDAVRLHRASKASPRVALYTHREWRTLERAYAGARIHEADAIEVFALDASMLESLVATLDRRNAWTLTVSEGSLYLDVSGAVIEATLTRRALPT